MNTLFLLQAAAAPKGSGISPLLMFGLIIVVFYFFMIRPQVKRQKEARKFREALKKGDRVVTTSGIYGKINAINENIVKLEIANGVFVEMDKSAIVQDIKQVEKK